MAQALMVKKGSTNTIYNGPPEFTYTGQHEFIDDGDGNWRLKFLTSGTLVILKPSILQIDLFLVGGGGAGGTGRTNSGYAYPGGGGGGGYTLTRTVIIIGKEIEYGVTIGSGGVYTSTTGGKGGDTIAFGFTANGGDGGGGGSYNSFGGNGGSGGGAGTVGTNIGNGGSDGGNGVDSGRGDGGIGQGTTTREFGDPNGTLYSGGGGGCSGKGGDGGGGNGLSANSAATPGTFYGGGGGGGGSNNISGWYGANGYQGIAVIRNTRTVVNTGVA